MMKLQLQARDAQALRGVSKDAQPVADLLAGDPGQIEDVIAGLTDTQLKHALAVLALRVRDLERRIKALEQNMIQ